MSSVVIIGAGPVGITCACLLKAQNPLCQITVLDKREKPTRSHGLSIDSASIAKITKLAGSCPELQNIFAGWGGHFVRTSAIETDLAALADKMGIKVLRGKGYGLNKGDLQQVFAGTSTLTQEATSALMASSLIIAADGAKSVVRKELGIKREDKRTLKYMVELKYETTGQALPQRQKDAIYDSSKTGHIGVELVNRERSDEKKPATYLVFVDKPTYEALRPIDSQGQVKGVYGNTWTLQEVEELGKAHKAIKKLSKTFSRYLSGLDARHGKVQNEQIATLELKIYRNSKSVTEFHGKPVVFLGDANSGLILQRGFNKGLQEVASLVEAATSYLAKPASDSSPSQAFLGYQSDAQNLFKKEKSAIFLKDKALDVAQSCASITSTFIEMVEFVAKSVFSLFVR